MLQIGLLGANYIASRLAFPAMGEPLPVQVDHLDRDSLNNRWNNLAPSTNAENHKNRSMNRNNTSGITGVYWNKPAGKWLAQVMLCGKRKNLGLFNDINEAAAVVATFYAANGYTARHGKKLAKYQKEAV
jgi:hypothetical protein